MSAYAQVEVAILAGQTPIAGNCGGKKTHLEGQEA